MFDTMKVAKKIKEARIAKDMTQQNLADAMEVSYQAVSNWERGNSMPDISKLGQLCKVLEIGMEELLGEGSETKTVEKILLRNRDSREAENAADEEMPGRETKVSLEELQGVLPIVPPKETKKILEENAEKLDEVNFEVLRELAVFLDEEYLDELINRYKGSLTAKQVSELAVFLSEEGVDKLMDRYVIENDTEILSELAVFASEEGLNRLVTKYKDKISFQVLEKIAVFMDEDDVGHMAIEMLERGETDNLSGLYPFMSDETLKQMAEMLVKKGDFKNLQSIAPFC